MPPQNPQPQLQIPKNWNDTRKNLFNRLNKKGSMELIKLLKSYYQRNELPPEVLETTMDVVQFILQNRGIDINKFKKYLKAVK